MGAVRYFGQIVLFIVTFLLIAIGFTTMSPDNNNWILAVVGAGVLLAARYFKRQLKEMGY